MDFALYVGEEKTVIYKKNHGIVLNEPSVMAYEKDKLIAVGKSAVKFFESDFVEFASPTHCGIIQNIDDTAIFLNQTFKKVGLDTCLCLIPSSLDKAGLDEYKTAIYTAGAEDAVFIPAVVALLASFDINIMQKVPVLSVLRDGDFADICVVNGGEIVAGGTITDIKKLDEAKEQLLAEYPDIAVYTGDRISIINGAGKLLKNPLLVKKIISLN